MDEQGDGVQMGNSRVLMSPAKRWVGVVEGRCRAGPDLFGALVKARGQRFSTPTWPRCGHLQCALASFARHTFVASQSLHDNSTPVDQDIPHHVLVFVQC